MNNTGETIEGVCDLIAANLYANADALAIEAGKYEELSAMLVQGDGPAQLESLLAGLLASDPGKWSSVWGDLQTTAEKIARNNGRKSHHAMAG